MTVLQAYNLHALKARRTTLTQRLMKRGHLQNVKHATGSTSSITGLVEAEES